MAFQDSAAVQAISAQWLELKAAGAPQDVLDSLHQRAQLLRSKDGYTADASGTIYKALKSAGERLTGTGPEELIEEVKAQQDETYYVISDGSGYDPTAYAASGKIDGQNIAGYVVLGVVGLVVLDKLLG